MRSALLAAVALALLSGAAVPRVQATPSAPAVAAKFAPVLGISYGSPRGTLAWFDPVTLRARPGRKAPLAGHVGSWAFSGDRRALALARCGGEGGGRRDQVPGIRFVDARAMRVLGDVRLARRDGCVDSLTWLRPDRLLAVVRTEGEAELAVIDPVRRLVVRRQELPGSPWDVERTRDEAFFLIGTYGAIAPARIVAADAEGSLRATTVEGVLAGTVVDELSADHRARTVHPGFAVDADTRRAFLVPASGPVAEVDLATLAASYRRLDEPSLLRRLLGWLEPAAHAKVMEGPVRQAKWLGEGLVAVSGMDHSIGADALGRPTYSGVPVGLRVIDTRSWSSRELDGAASGFAVAPGLVVAQGGSWDQGADTGSGPGLRAFGLDGSERWHLYPGEYRWMDAAGPVGYAYRGDSAADVVQLATGVVLRTVRWSERAPLPQLLAAQTSEW